MTSLNRRSAPAAEPAGQAISGNGLKHDAASKKASMLRPTARTWTQDGDIQRRWSTSSAHDAGKWLPFIALSFQAIGVVYGDIGTSFIYVFPAVFTEAPTSEDVVGAASLVVWTITSLVLIKYALIVLRADDNGQGGTFALFSLLKRQAELGSKSISLDKSLSQYSYKGRTSAGSASHKSDGATSRDSKRQRFIQSKTTQNIIRVLVVFGVGAIMGDGVLTPSVSIVSACEGINVRWPDVTRWTIDGIAVGIVVLLFAAQRFGTGQVGLLFSPIITLWLLANACIGIYNIAHHKPDIFIALSPHKWFAYFLRRGHEGWRSLGGVLLCVTGCEALFADLGHFSRKAIQFSFAFLAWPCLILTYLGQAAYLSKNVDSYSTSFWDALPNGTFYPMWILATLASIIASQALISAVFQIVKQAITQGFFPRFTIIHTSKKHVGQVYIPFMCYVLGILCIILILTFKTSAQLTKAYGLAVILDMILTTHFCSLVMLCVWRISPIFPLTFYTCFFAIEATFLSATAEKVPTGGWFSLMICGIATIIMLLWFWGSKQKNEHFLGKASNLSRLLQVRQLEGSSKGGDPNVGLAIPQIMVNGDVKAARLPGVAIYYSDILYGAPPALEAQVSRFPALHEVNVFATIRFVPVPEVLEDERLLIKQLPIAGFYHVIARYGYSQVVKQDELFVDTVLQKISLLLYSELHQFIHSSPQLQHTFANLPPPAAAHGDSPHAIDEIAVPILGASTEAAFGNSTKAVEIDPDLKSNKSFPSSFQGTLVTRNSAPVGSLLKGSLTKVSNAFSPANSAPFSSNFADSTFQSASGVDDFSLDALTAQALSSWAMKAVSGEVKVPQGLERGEQLARDIHVLVSAREHGVVFIVGKTQARSADSASIIKKYLVHEPFLFLVHNFTSDSDAAFGIPPEKVAIVGLPFQLN